MNTEPKTDADWYHVECDDPDYSQFFDNWADALTLVSEHGGEITALREAPWTTEVAYVARLERTLSELVKAIPTPRAQKAQAPYDAALQLVAELEGRADYSINLPTVGG